MNIILDILNELNQQGVNSGERRTNAKGELVPDASLGEIDPVSIRGGSDKKDQAEFDKETKNGSKNDGFDK